MECHNASHYFLVIRKSTNNTKINDIPFSETINYLVANARFAHLKFQYNTMEIIHKTTHTVKNNMLYSFFLIKYFQEINVYVTANMTYTILGMGYAVPSQIYQTVERKQD